MRVLLYILILVVAGCSVEEKDCNDHSKSQSEADLQFEGIIEQAKLMRADDYLEEAYFVLDSAINQKGGGALSPKILAEAHHELGIIQYLLEDDQKALDHYRKEIKLLEELPCSPSLALAKVYRNMGTLYNYIEDYYAAADTLGLALQYQQSSLNDSSDQIRLIDINRELALALTQIDDLKRAEEHFLVARQGYEKFYVEEPWELAALYNDLILYFKKGNQLDSMLFYAQKALDQYEIMGPESMYDVDSIGMARVQNNLGIAYYALDSIESALDAYQASLVVNEFYDQSLEIADNYNNISLISLKKGNSGQAKELINAAISIQKDIGGNAFTLADYYNTQAEILLSINQSEEALLSINQSIILLTNEKEVEVLLSRLSSDDDRLIISDPLELAKSLVDRARILNNRWENKQQAADLVEAIESYQTAFQLYNEIRADFGSSQSKRFFTTNIRQHFEEAIQANYQAYLSFSKDKKYIENILAIMEQSKAVSLLDQLNIQQSKIVANIPAEILEREEALKRNIAQLEQGINQDQNEQINKLVLARQELKDFRETLFKEYPNYYNLRKPDLISFDEIQKDLLTPDQAFIQYFTGTSDIYILYLEKGKFEFLVKEKPKDLKSTIEKLSALLSVQESPVSEFSSLSQYLNEILLQDVQEKMDSGIDRLLIVPDGILSYTPFDLLPTEKVEKIEGFLDFPFLLKKMSVGYAYSATVWKLQSEYGSVPSKEFGLFVVNDYSGYPNLSNLSGNIASDIQKNMRGDLFENQKAAKVSFIQRSGDYKVLFLSMHAVLDNETPLNSGLIFYDEEGNGALPMSELYSLDLNCGLIVLSACETGSGRLENGEGVISLAHATAYAGAAATTMTLWQIPNQESITIMGFYFDQLNNGLGKDRALQSAKLKYLESTKSTFARENGAHPHFWAAFVNYGDQVSIDKMFVR